ncbi:MULTISPECIES: putrescine-ornithine antiporter [Staphylococcus]|uniref:Putrescine transporter n=1 Tax=Staphylococcus argensis TaxID=1607738 RepID=A0A2K4FDY4_9STAP|nr:MULTISPECIES: putrescine-ornithine antiporter [Staphylococcus]MCY1607585.1 putrescine-ornithine antiporter [Staphylococcus pettenkoferi]MCY6990963.1 putrescine-ornithine antiporter [Staphylococcus argensis]POA09493.1 putrescine-ornithine antiporter [Staphylococcus argensis]
MAEKKKMSVTQLTIVTAVNMMGSGIIMLPTNLAQVGTMSILSWLATTIGAVLLAFIFARAGLYSSKGGGMGGYAEYSFGKAGAFMTNYTYGLSLVIANAAIAISAVGYTAELFHVSISPLATAFWTIIVLWVATILNFGGPRITGQISSVTVWGVILPVVFICIVGWFYFSGHNFAKMWNPHNYSFFDGMSKSISITLWAFLGLESASANSDAVENPKKNVPIAVMGGTIGAAIMYIISTNVILGISPIRELAHSNAPFGLAFSQMFTPTVGNIVIALMIISCFGSLVGWQFTIAEVFRTSADERYFPKVFSKTIGNGVPLVGMIVITILQTLISLMTISPSLSKQFTILVNLAVVTNAIPYVLTMASIKTMQKESNVNVKPKRANWINIIGLIAGIYTLYAIYSAGGTAVYYGAIVTFAGWTLYGIISHRFDTVNKNDSI